MILYCAIVVTLCLVVLVVQAVRKERLHQEIWDVLAIDREYQESQRINRKEANLTREDVVKTVKGQAEKLSSKIEEVPGKVADVLKAGESGILKASEGEGK